MVQPTHKELREILAYWLKKKGNRFAPSRNDIDPADITPLLPFVGLVDVLREPSRLRFRYRLAGTEITRSYGQELTGRYLDDVDLASHEAEIFVEYKTAAERSEPVCATWDYTRSDGRHIRYERLALPLSSDGKTVDILFGGCVFEKPTDDDCPIA